MGCFSLLFVLLSFSFLLICIHLLVSFLVLVLSLGWLGWPFLLFVPLSLSLFVWFARCISWFGCVLAVLCSYWMRCSKCLFCDFVFVWLLACVCVRASCCFLCYTCCNHCIGASLFCLLRCSSFVCRSWIICNLVGSFSFCSFVCGLRCLSVASFVAGLVWVGNFWVTAGYLLLLCCTFMSFHVVFVCAFVFQWFALRFFECTVIDSYWFIYWFNCLFVHLCFAVAFDLQICICVRGTSQRGSFDFTSQVGRGIEKIRWRNTHRNIFT